MKKALYTFVALAVALAAATSCSKDDDEVAAKASDNCYISGFALGQMRRAIAVKSSTGEDSTYYVSFTGAYYPLVIDQRQNTIRLAKPLPAGTRLDAVLTTLSYVGSLQHAAATDTTTWADYSSNDSVDFTVPRIYRVRSADGSSYRDYDVRLTVRTDDPDAYTWTRSEADMPLVNIPARTWQPADYITEAFDIVADVDYVQRNGNHRALLACRKKDAPEGTPLAIWSLLVDTDEDWTLFDISPDNPYTLPSGQKLHIVAYDYMLLVFSEGSRTILVSRDNGITWKTIDGLSLPDDVEVSDPQGTPLPMSALSLGDTVWLSVGGETWTVRRNGYGED